MLGRAGIPTVLIDPHQVYPFDFRVEKISGDEQLDRFYQTGIADSELRSATDDGENWVARFGYLLDKKPSHQYSISIGFDLVPVGRPTFEFPALTYFSEGVRERVAYVTLFPVGARMRANLSSTARSTIPGCARCDASRPRP
jgi:hypothetical protein